MGVECGPYKSDALCGMCHMAQDQDDSRRCVAGCLDSGCLTNMLCVPSMLMFEVAERA